MSSMLFLALEFHDDVLGGVLANANCGGVQGVCFAISSCCCCCCCSVPQMSTLGGQPVCIQLHIDKSMP